MSSKRTFLSSSLFQGLSTISRVLYSMLIAATFGATGSMDSYVAASSIVIAIDALLNNSQTNTLIPYLGKEEASFKNKLIQIGNFNFLFVFAIVGLLIILSPFIIRIVAPGLSTTQQVTATSLLRLLSFTIIASNINAIGSALLKLHNKIEITYLFALINAVISLVILFFGGKKAGIFIFPVLLIAANFPFVIYSALLLRRKGFKVITLSTYEWKEQLNYLKLLSPVLLSWFFVWIIKFTDNNIASRFDIGSMSYISYCTKIMMFAIVLPNIICGITFPQLSKQTSKEDKENYSKIFYSGLSRLLLLIIPISITIFVFGKPILGLLFERGTFTIEDTLNISILLKGYILVIACAPLGSYFSNVFFSYQKPKYAVIYSIISSVTNVVLNIILSQFWGVLGLVIASSFSYFLGTTLQVTNLKRVNSLLNFNEILRSNFKILISGALTFIATLSIEPFLLRIIQTVKTPLISHTILTCLGSFLCFAIFIFCLFITKDKNMRKIIKR